MKIQRIIGFFAFLLIGATMAHAQAWQITSKDLILICDPDSGRFVIDGQGDAKGIHQPLISATVGVTFGDTSIAGIDTRFKRTIQRDSDQSPIIGGKRLRLTLRDSEKQVDLESRMTLLPQRAGAILELLATNVSSADLVIPSCEPLRAIMDELAGGKFGEYKSDKKVLTNGYIYYDPGKLLDFTRKCEIDSYWDAAFFLPETRQGLVVGFLDNDRGEGHILASRLRSNPALMVNNGFNLTARSNFHQAFTLRPGETISSGKVLVLFDNNPHDALEFYVDTMARLHHAKPNPIINGWCTWFVYYGGAKESDIIEHAKFVARELKPCGMDWIQIDDGYQRAFGDWEGNGRFPHGMKWLADQIRAQGLKPGLWIAPFAISANTDIAKSHPDWLVHNAQGELQQIVKEHQGQAQYILDITHPGAQQWLENLLHTIAHDWGYDFIKTDFVEWTILAAERFHDPTCTKAQAYRLGNEIIRRAIGPERHLLDCGPTPMIVGLADSMRVGLDRPDDLPNFDLWEQYAGHHNSAIGAIAKRYYFGGRTWVNDPDHLRLARLPIAQAQAAATIIALSGGTTISGDNLPKLDAARLVILRKVLPSYGKAAKPIDLFDQVQAEIFAVPIQTKWESWTMLASFNANREIDLMRLGLARDKTFLAYDFWSQKLLDEAQGKLELSAEPKSVRLIALREKQDVPQILGTDRHWTCGGIELEDCRWDANSRTLAGSANGLAAGGFNLSFFVPQGYKFDQNASASASGLSDIIYEAPVLRGHVTAARWSLTFQKR